jgi:hypothetical protein
VVHFADSSRSQTDVPTLEETAPQLSEASPTYRLALASESREGGFAGGNGARTGATSYGQRLGVHHTYALSLITV